MKKNRTLLIVFIVFIISIFIFRNKVYAGSETISGFSATVAHKAGNSNVSMQGSLSGDPTGAEKKIVVNTEKTYAYFKYEVTGLDSEKLYIVSADFKTENVTGGGAIVGTEKYEAFYNFGLSSGLTGTKDWTEKSIVIKPKKDGKATVFFGFGYHYKDYGFSTGTLYIKNISIKDASLDSSVKINESSNKRVKFVMWEEDYNKSGVEDDEFELFLDRLEDMYNNILDLVGNSSHGKLYPFNNEQVVYMLTNTHQYGALSGYPIEVNSNYAISLLKDGVESNRISWIFLHETAHLFDLALSNIDNTYTTSNFRFSIDEEQSASFYPLYAMDKMNLITDNSKDLDGWIDFYKNTYSNYLSQGTYYGDGLSYLLTQVRKNGEIDWDAFKSTYTWFNDLTQDTFDNVINDSNIYRRNYIWFLKKLDDYSEVNVRNIFENNVLETIFEKYVPFDEINLDLNTNSLENQTLTDNYQLNVITYPLDSNDILVYESSNEDVATIDDFGKVTLKSTIDDNVTITVRSYFDPNVKTSYTFKVGTTADLEDDSDEIKDIEKEEDIVENPQTGVYYSLGFLFTILVVGILIIIYSKKSNKFPKIWLIKNAKINKITWFII